MPKDWETRWNKDEDVVEMWNPWTQEWHAIFTAPTLTNAQTIKYLQEQIAYAKTHFPTRVHGLQNQLAKLQPIPKH
jgi:hypothetical protein